MSDSDVPPAPPPTLVTDTSTDSKSYHRNFLLSLATPQARPPHPERVKSFSKLLRNDSGRWGEDESASELLDGSRGSSPSSTAPIAKVPVEPAKEVLFEFKTPGETPAPVMVDFTTPDPFVPVKAAPPRKASNIFQSFPGTNNFSNESVVSAGEVAHSLGDKFQTLRLGARLDSVDIRSRSPSLGSNEAPRLSRASSISSERGKLNAFAAPWPLPHTTPRIPISEGASPATSSPSSDASLPLPKLSALPASLPPKPNATLPPVFVKRETAALPQSMALPDIAPLGKDWEGENSLSGNDKRRRASELGFAPLPLPRSSLVEGLMSKSLKEEARPERLVRMGQNWRASVSGQGERIRS